MKDRQLQASLLNDSPDLTYDSDNPSKDSVIKHPGFEMETSNVRVGMKNTSNGDERLYDIDDGRYINTHGIEQKIAEKNEVRDAIKHDTSLFFKKDFTDSAEQIYWNYGNEGGAINPVLVDDQGRAYFMAEIDPSSNQITVKLEAGRELRLSMSHDEYNLSDLAQAQYAIDAGSVHSLMEFSASNERNLNVSASVEGGILGPNAGASISFPEICLFGLGFQCSASINGGIGLKGAVGAGITFDKTQLRLRPYLKVGGYAGAGMQTEIKVNVGLDTDAGKRISEASEALLNEPMLRDTLADIRECIKTTEQENPDSMFGQLWKEYKLQCWHESENEISESIAHMAGSSGLFAIRKAAPENNINVTVNVNTNSPSVALNDNNNLPDVTNNVIQKPNDTKLQEIRNKINADYDYSLPRSTNPTINLPKKHWEADHKEENTSLIRDYSLSGGSVYASNDNRDRELRWRIELPLPLGVAVLSVKAAIDKIRDLKTPDHVKHISDSLALLKDSYTMSASYVGIKNFLTKNFNQLSKSELIARREQDVLDTIYKAIDAMPNDVNLRRECGYVICAIKNKCPEMMSLYFSNEKSDRTIIQELATQYQTKVNRDIDNFISLGMNRSSERFQSAKELVSKYPYEADVHEIMAISSKNAGKFDLALKALEQYRILKQGDIFEEYKNCIDQQPDDFLSGRGNSSNQLKNVSDQCNSNIDKFKIDILLEAMTDSPDHNKSIYKNQLVNSLHDALRINSKSVSYYSMLVNIYVNDNQLHKAIEYQSKIVELNKSPLTLIQLADLYSRNGANHEAQKVLDILENTYKSGSKEDYDTQCYLREWYEYHGNVDKSMHHAKNASLSPFAPTIEANQKDAISQPDECQEPEMHAEVKSATRQVKILKSGKDSVKQSREANPEIDEDINSEKSDKDSQAENITQQACSMISLISFLAGLKLRDRTLNEATRKNLTALTSVASLVKASLPLFIRYMGQKDSIPRLSRTKKMEKIKSDNLQNLNLLLTCASLLHSLVQELQDQGVMNKSSYEDQIYTQLSFQCASLVPVIYELGFMAIVKNTKVDYFTVAFSAASALSTVLQAHQSYCKLHKMELYDSYDYHFFSNSLWVVPTVINIAGGLGIIGFATGKIAAGVLVIGVEPITGIILISAGAGTLGGLTYATYMGIDYCAESDRASSLAHNAQLLAEKEDYLGAIKKLDQSLMCNPDIKIEMQRGLYHCQHHIKEGNNEKVKEEATKWLKNNDINANDRLNFLNFRIMLSIQNTEASLDADELWGMYTVLAGTPDNKTENEINNKSRDAMKNNMATLLYKSATESNDHLSSIKKLDDAMKLTPNDDSIPKVRRRIEYDYDYTKGNQSQLMEKCINSLTTNPDDLLALKYSSLVTLQQKKFKSSRHYLNLWVKAEPENALPHNLLSKTALLQDDLIAAKIHAKNAMDLSKKLYEVKSNLPHAENTGDPKITEEQLEELKAQYQDSKNNYTSIQQGIATLYTCSLAQAAGKVSAEAVGILAGNIGKLFFANNERDSTSHFSFSMWKKPGTYFDNNGQHSNSNGCSRHIF